VKILIIYVDFHRPQFLYNVIIYFRAKGQEEPEDAFQMAFTYSLAEFAGQFSTIKGPGAWYILVIP